MLINRDSGIGKGCIGGREFFLAHLIKDFLKSFEKKIRYASIHFLCMKISHGF